MSVPPVSVRVTGDDSELQSALDQSTRRLQTFGRRAGQIARTMGIAFAGAVTGIATGLGIVTRQSLALLDEQSKLARQFGTTVEGIQTLTRAAELSGVSIGTLTQASTRLQQTLGQVARTGKGEAADALRSLGLEARNLQRLNMEERFIAIAEAIKTKGMSADDAADALRRLGIRQGEVRRLLEDGGAAITRAREEVRLFGVAVNDVDARAIETANDAWSRFGLMVRGIGNQLAVHLAPILKTIADRITDFVREAGGMENIVGPAVERVIRIFAWFAREIHMVRVAFDELFADIINGFNRVAGSIPRAVEAITRGAVTAAQLGYRDIEHTFGRLREQLGIAPSGDQWVSWFRNLREETRMTDATLRAHAELRRQLIEKFGDPDKPVSPTAPGAGATTTRDTAAAEEERLRKQIERRLEIIREGLMTEEQLRDHQLERNIALVKRAHETDVINEKERNQMIEDLRKQHGERMAKIQQAVNMRALRDTASTFGTLAQLAQSGGERLVKITQALGVAQALINAYVGATEALKLPFPANLAAFAKVLATGLSAVASIRRVSTRGGGGATAGAAGGGGAITGGGGAQETQQPGNQRSVMIDVRGDFFGRETIRGLVEQIDEFYRDGGGRVVVR